MTIGSRIRSRRLQLGMTQDELAKKLGYESRTSINKIEHDTRNLTQQRIADIAKALETTPSYIMGWQDPSDAEFIQNLGYLHPLEELPEDIAALNAFLYCIGERIIKTNGRYFLGEIGELSDGDLKRLTTAATTAIKVTYDMIVKEKKGELMSRLSGDND